MVECEREREICSIRCLTSERAEVFALCALIVMWLTQESESCFAPKPGVSRILEELQSSMQSAENEADPPTGRWADSGCCQADDEWASWHLSDSEATAR